MVKKKKATPRKVPQSAVCLSAEGRSNYDKLKRKVEKSVGMDLTHNQVIATLLKQHS